MANIGIPPKGGIQIEGIDVDVNLDSKDDILSGAILNIPYRTKTFPKGYYHNEEKPGVSFRSKKKLQDLLFTINMKRWMRIQG